MRKYEPEHRAKPFQSPSDNMVVETRRERIRELLESITEPLTVQDICEELGLRSGSQVSEDLEHIARSLKHEGKELLVRPPSCGKCGHVFTGRASTRTPSRCPKCRSTWILPPAFTIRSRK